MNASLVKWWHSDSRCPECCSKTQPDYRLQSYKWGGDSKSQVRLLTLQAGAGLWLAGGVLKKHGRLVPQFVQQDATGRSRWRGMIICVTNVAFAFAYGDAQINLSVGQYSSSINCKSLSVVLCISGSKRRSFCRHNDKTKTMRFHIAKNCVKQAYICFTICNFTTMETSMLSIFNTIKQN
jgi:hypothetical protein